MFNLILALFIISVNVFSNTFIKADLVQTDKSVNTDTQEYIINVNEVGIYGNGRDDVTDKIQKLIYQSSGKTLFLPKGSYLISRPLVLINGIKLLGEGDVGSIGGSVIQPVAKISLLSVFIVADNKLSDVIFENIRTLGAKSSLLINTHNDGFLTKVKWYNCVFQEHEVAIRIIGSTSTGMYANMFRDCYFKNCRKGIYCEGVYNINIIQGCGFENMGGSYLEIGSESSASLGNSFVENRCESVKFKNGTSILLNKSTYGFYIERNYVENSFKEFLRSNGARNISIENNVFTADDEGRHLIMINKGSALIKNNTSLRIQTLSVENQGYCEEVIGNTLLDFDLKVKRENMGHVRNEFNKRFNNVYK